MNGILRTALAAVFAFMTLFHGPVMTFAKASPVHHAMHATQAGHAAHHHHEGMPQREAPADPATIPACFAFGCFVVMESLPVQLPVTLLNLIGGLLPGIARPMRPSDMEPPVPPPRLQV